jgi:similar to stage IV sporulation protein
MIDISGAKQLTLQQIADSLAESGVKIGMKRNKIDRDEAQRVMMTKLPEIGWIGINVKGSTVIVDVKERTVLPPAFDRDSPRSFIAASDGVITEINVTDGVQSVKIGDVVRKGQMLISGQVESETTPTRFVRADGVVFARVWHEETVDLPLYEEIKTATGKNKSKHTLKIFDFYVKLYISDKVRFENYDRTSYVKSFFLGNHNILPLTFHYDHYAEQSVERRALTGEAAIALVKKRMDEQYELPEIVRRDVQIADGKVKAVYECIENIAKETAVNVEEEVHDDGENP